MYLTISTNPSGNNDGTFVPLQHCENMMCCVAVCDGSATTLRHLAHQSYYNADISAPAYTYWYFTLVPLPLAAY